MVATVRQPNFVQQLPRARDGVAPTRDLHRHQDVLEGGQRRHEVEELEDEADLLAAQSRQFVFAEGGDVDAVDEDLARARGIEAGQQAQECGLAAARRTDDRHELAGRDRQIEWMQNRQGTAAAIDRLRHAAQIDHRSCFSRSGSSTPQRRCAIIVAPSAFGWIPSALFSEAMPATPSRKNGTNTTSCSSARSR